MSFSHLVAHAGEHHTTTAETSFHYLQEWYIAIPLLLVVVGVLGWLIYLMSKHSKPTTFIFITSILLIVGVGSYSISPVMSITALAVGLALILLMVLFSLMQKPIPNKKQ